jgi:hypothetical protein
LFSDYYTINNELELTENSGNKEKIVDKEEYIQNMLKEHRCVK